MSTNLSDSSIVFCKNFDSLSAKEIFDILQLRAKVFIVEQNCAYLDPDDKDKESFHLGIYLDNTLIACSRLLPEGISYKTYCSIGRVCTHLEFRSRKIGIELMNYSLEYIETLFPGVPIKISAQSYLINFYNKFGFEVTGEEYMEDNIPHTAMIKIK
ncbi:MAG: GNAT family N-acetyltransferase [Saprospiraceae bacterium]|nr:GNAT family N-acetyltransferase [Saprospiraceae bacterium]